MRTHAIELTLSTRGDGDVIDVSEHAQAAIDGAGIAGGTCTVWVAHSTCGITTIECEPGCVADLERVMERLTPAADRYEHNERNADTNGHSHIRAALIGPSVTVPVIDGKLALGTWQRVVCVDFDDRPRSRRLVVQVLGV
jgi:secondary thiamine-phosphate synthase enzyme